MSNETYLTQVDGGGKHYRAYVADNVWHLVAHGINPRLNHDITANTIGYVVPRPPHRRIIGLLCPSKVEEFQHITPGSLIVGASVDVRKGKLDVYYLALPPVVIPDYDLARSLRNAVLQNPFNGEKAIENPHERNVRLADELVGDAVDAVQRWRA